MASDGNDQDAEYTLSKLLQMGTVKDYQREFEMLIKRVTIPESLLKSFYVSGLTGSTMFTLKVKPPNSRRSFFIGPCGGNTLREPRHLRIFEVQSFNFGRRLLQSSVNLLHLIFKGSLDADEDIGVDDVSSAIDGVFNIGESNVKSIEVRSKFGEFTENKASLDEVVVGGGEVFGVGEDDDLCNATGRG
nr:hypothetical protein [Tanacetum cinerariifolium]